MAAFAGCLSLSFVSCDKDDNPVESPSYGFFENYALTSVGGITPADADGNALLDANGNTRSDAVTFNIIDSISKRKREDTVSEKSGISPTTGSCSNSIMI